MRANIAVFAKTAHTTPSGALLRLEAPFNTYSATTFPAEIKGLMLVLDIVPDPLEYGQLKSFSIRIVDPDGHQLATLTSEPLQFASSYPGYPVSFCQLIPLTVLFPDEGLYSFEIRAGDHLLTEVPLYVGPLPGTLRQA